MRHGLSLVPNSQSSCLSLASAKITELPWKPFSVVVVVNITAKEEGVVTWGSLWGCEGRGQVESLGELFSGMCLYPSNKPFSEASRGLTGCLGLWSPGIPRTWLSQW